MVDEAWSITTSFNATVASKEELAALSSTVDELKVTLDSLSAQTQTTESYLTENIELLKLLVAVALVLALAAAAAAISALYLMLQKNKTQK